MRALRPTAVAALPLVAGILTVPPSMAAAGEVGELVSGVVTEYVVDHRSAPSEIRQFLTTDSRRSIPLVAPVLEAGAEVTVRLADRPGGASAVEQVVATDPDPDPGTAAAAPVEHPVYVAVVAPTDAPFDGSEMSVEQAVASVQAAGAYWDSQTGGRIRLRVAAETRRYVSAYACADVASLRAEAIRKFRSSATAASPLEAPGAHVVLAVPTQGRCAYGIGSVGSGPASGGIAIVAARPDDTSVVAHELGHNLGLGHSGSLICSGRPDSPVSLLWPGCSIQGYDDPLDVMGASGFYGDGALNGAHIDDLGLQPESVQEIATGSGTHTVTLAPLGAGQGTRVVKVVVDEDEAYFVQYRRPVGADASARVSQWYGWGVEIHKEHPGTEVDHDSLFLDPTPPDAPLQRALPVGSTFTAATADLQVTVVQQDATAATVRITSLTAGSTVVELPVTEPPEGRPVTGTPPFVAVPTTVTIAGPVRPVRRAVRFEVATKVRDQRGKAMPRVRLTLQRRVKGTSAWRGLASATTDRKGRATASVRTRKQARYRWVTADRSRRSAALVVRLR